MIRFNQEYYERVVKQNGYEFCANLEMPLPGLSTAEMQKWLCVYNLSTNLVSELNKEDTLFIAGVGVNREPHIGTISQLLRMLYLQKNSFLLQSLLHPQNGCRILLTFVRNYFVTVSAKNFYGQNIWKIVVQMTKNPSCILSFVTTSKRMKKNGVPPCTSIVSLANR